jgi:tetratricopeptide (TPR) repeat protein
VQAGQRDAALATLTDSLEIARAMRGKEPQVWSLKVVVVAFAKAGEFNAAIETAREIYDKWTQAKALKLIAIMQVEAGHFDEALETVGKIDREQTPGEAFLLAKTTVQARAKKFDAALDTAKEMTNESTWSDAMCQIAVSRAQAREFDAAIDTVQKMNKENQQAAILGYIAAEQAKAGDIEAAQSTFNNALKKAQQIGQELERATALKEIAEAQVEAGFGHQALKTAETILVDRDRYLPRIAASFVETGDKANFKKLLIPCAYYLEAAYEMCGHLARLYPEKTEEIAKVVSDFN